MHVEILRREIVDHWHGLLAWIVGAVLLTALYVFFYPSIHSHGAGIQKLLNSMPKAFRNAFMGSGVDYLSPAGYLGTELFGVYVPALLLVLGILAGGRALAGEERDGTIDLLLSTPLPRSRLVIEKAVGGLTPLFGVAAAVWLAVAVLGPSQGLTVHLGRLAEALIAVALLATLFGMLAFLVASATGSPGLGGGVAAAAAMAMYALNIIGSLVVALSGFAKAVSPFHWDGGAGVLVTGVAWWAMLLLIVCPTALVGISIVLYGRRDLTA